MVRANWVRRPCLLWARGEVTLVYPRLRNPYDGTPANADLQAQVLLRVLLYCPQINSKTHRDVKKAAIPILSNPYTTKKLQAAPTICKHNKASVTSLCGGSTKQEYGALNYKLLQPEKAKITSLCIDDQSTPTATPKPENRMATTNPFQPPHNPSFHAVFHFPLDSLSL